MKKFSEHIYPALFLLGVTNEKNNTSPSGLFKYSCSVVIKLIIKNAFLFIRVKFI